MDKPSSNEVVRLGGHVVGVAQLQDALKERDSDLVRSVVQLLQGDSSQQEEALYAVQRALRGTVRAWLRRDWFKDDASIEDVWIRTLARISARTASFDPSRSAFATWVFNQAKYAALDYRRELAAELRVEQRDRALRPEPAVEWDDEREPITDREKDCLRRAKRKLSDTERRLLELRYEEERSYAEILEETGLNTSVSNLRVNVFRAARKLKGLYEGELQR